MSAPARTAPPPPGGATPPPAPKGAPPAPPTGPGSGVATWSTGNTPGWYRMYGTVGVAAAAVLALTAFVGTFVMASSADEIQSNTAPSLVAVQQLSAAVAEANSNATAAFLSAANGSEDRQRRVAYLDSLRRSAEQTEAVSALIGDDPDGHENLADVAVALTSYSGSIEAARTKLESGRNDEAVADLGAALDLTGGDVALAVAEVTAANQNRYDDQSGAGVIITVAAIAVAVVTLLLLVFMQIRTASLSNRIINPGMFVATVATVTLAVLLVRGLSTNQAALQNASDGGYDAIATTSRLQSGVNDVQTQLSLRLLGRAEAELDEPFTRINADIAVLEAEADSEREVAAARALATRLDRYEDSARTTLALAQSGDDAAAAALARGGGFSDFNGVNTSIEGVLSDNRRQFNDGVDAAASAMTPLPWLSIVLPVIAALGLAWGVQQRLRDYR